MCEVMYKAWCARWLLSLTLLRAGPRTAHLIGAWCHAVATGLLRWVLAAASHVH
jgi:hypothetical protein